MKVTLIAKKAKNHSDTISLRMRLQICHVSF